MTGSPPPPTSGEEAAQLATTDFVECYREHYSRLVRALQLAGADRASAEDLAQEAFARALARWRRISSGPNPAGYVYLTAFRLLRRRWAWLRTKTPAALAAGPSDPTTMLAIGEALRKMPPKRRACAVLCLVAGLRPHEAGEALHMADGTVRKHLEQARRDLDRALYPQPS